MTDGSHRAVLRKIARRRQRAAVRAGPDERPGPGPRARGTARCHPVSARAAAQWPSPVLTRRELEVLHLVATGATDRGIAELLYISRRTVNSHVASILTKLEVPSRRRAVIAAAQSGLL
jgi:DNA-binding CsgD family transcriptional regulator